MIKLLQLCSSYTLFGSRICRLMYWYICNFVYCAHMCIIMRCIYKYLRDSRYSAHILLRISQSFFQDICWTNKELRNIVNIYFCKIQSTNIGKTNLLRKLLLCSRKIVEIPNCEVVCDCMLVLPDLE